MYAYLILILFSTLGLGTEPHVALCLLHVHLYRHLETEFDSMKPLGFHEARSVAELAVHSQNSWFRRERLAFQLSITTTIQHKSKSRIYRGVGIKKTRVSVVNLRRCLLKVDVSKPNPAGARGAGERTPPRMYQ